MPPDRSRTVNAQGRQKSCSECAKGKRKCDLGQPSCTRCSKQQLTCIYPLSPQHCASLRAAAQDFCTDFGSDLDLQDAAFGFEETAVSTAPLDFDVVSIPTASTGSTDILDFDISAGTASLGSLSNMLRNASNQEDQLSIGLAPPCHDKSFSLANLCPMTESRIGWSIEKMKSASRMVVEGNGTPWQHPMLYNDYMPRSLQDAHAACALFITRSDKNKDFFARFITSRVEELVASPIPRVPVDLLGRAHAMILYQTMLIFGDDVRLHGHADLMLPILTDVGNALMAIAKQQSDPTGALPFYPSGAARAAWSAYIFRESLRRTMFLVFQFATMCHVLRGQMRQCSMEGTVWTKVTLSAQLWNAKNPLDFAIAWNDTKHFLVEGLDFTEVMRDAQPDDVDTFSKMILIAIMGIDDVKGWFFTKGGVL